MPLRPAAFTNLTRYVDTRIDASAFRIPEVDVNFDWGFDLDVPWERLSVFTRHIDTAAACTRVPVFALSEFGLTAASSNALDDPEAEERIAFPLLPLGVVGTDHVGYGSFDLWPLRNVTILQALKNALSDAGMLAAGRPRLTVRVSRLLVLPFKDPTIAFDALVEGDLGPDFICLRMDLDVVMLADRQVWPPMPPMQTPGIDDWRISPGSFSMAGALLIGENGCETLLPANLATRMVRFRQLVRTATEASASRGREQPRFFEVPGFSGVLRLGYGVTYHSEWFPVGHSLGQISYSLPLAPGEKMKIAVVDWSRHDAAKRSEQTTEKEDLQHAALRDRTLTEAVQMVVRESQSGSSFMAGGALSAGAGIPIGPVSLGVGGAFGLGGASTDSQGMRSIVGDTTQKISDAFHQASSAQRELNSTVVVQADQAEAAEARTRVVANYNHSHALTILYYEVLQHHRVLTKPASVRPIVFLKHEAVPFDFSLSGEPDYTLIERYMREISANLLDESVRECLEVVKKRACLLHNLEREKAKRKAQGDPLDDMFLGDITITVKSGAIGANFNVMARIVPKSGTQKVDCNFTDEKMTAFLRGVPSGIAPSPDQYFLNIFANFAWRRDDAPSVPSPLITASSEHTFGIKPLLPLRWKNVRAIELAQTIAPANRMEGGDTRGWIIEDIRITTAGAGQTWVMKKGRPEPNVVPFNDWLTIPVDDFKPLIESVDDLLSDDERCCLRRLIEHLNAHAGHYWRAIWLSELPADRAVRLEDWKVGTIPLLDLVENTLLDVDGEYVVMPVAAGAETKLDREFQTRNLGLSKTPYLEYVEQLLTLPARGVFAEAKLGHCNASELIDPSRFWDWQTSPIPDDAPEIAPSSTDSRYQDPTKGLAATPFPTPIVNIVNPQSLPDPTGFSAASGVLSALGPFRDMSGIKELGSYLETLSNNATQLASQGMKNAQTAGLMNTIRSAKELPPEKRADLMSELLTGQVKNHVEPPAPAPDPKPQPQPQPEPQPQPQPKPTPEPTPKGVPRPSEPQKPVVLGPKTRRITFTFLFDTGQEMWGNYQVELQDTQAMRSYIPPGDQTYTNILYIDLPSSVKAGAVVRVQGTVKPRNIQAPSGIEPQTWSLNIQKTEQFGSMEGVTGFNIIGQTKEGNLELTLETENENTTAKTDSDEWGASVKAGGTIKVVELEGEGSYKYTKTSENTVMVGNKEVKTMKFSVRMLDKQKQPKIEAVK
jgi:hypothetical protein